MHARSASITFVFRVGTHLFASSRTGSCSKWARLKGCTCWRSPVTIRQQRVVPVKPGSNDRKLLIRKSTVETFQQSTSCTTQTECSIASWGATAAVNRRCIGEFVETLAIFISRAQRASCVPQKIIVWTHCIYLYVVTTSSSICQYHRNIPHKQWRGLRDNAHPGVRISSHRNYSFCFTNCHVFERSRVISVPESELANCRSIACNSIHPAQNIPDTGSDGDGDIS